MNLDRADLVSYFFGNLNRCSKMTLRRRTSYNFFFGKFISVVHQIVLTLVLSSLDHFQFVQKNKKKNETPLPIVWANNLFYFINIFIKENQPHCQ
jgi:hypothetical protein